jgi:hypothetical protein
MVSSGLLRRVALVRTDVSEEPCASFIRVTKIGELGTTQAATSNRRTLRRNTTIPLSCHPGTDRTENTVPYLSILILSLIYAGLQSRFLVTASHICLFRGMAGQYQPVGHDHFMRNPEASDSGVRLQKHQLRRSAPQVGHWVCTCYSTYTNCSTGWQHWNTESPSLRALHPPAIKTSLFIRESENVCFQNGSSRYLIALLRGQALKHSGYSLLKTLQPQALRCVLNCFQHIFLK